MKHVFGQLFLATRKSVGIINQLANVRVVAVNMLLWMVDNNMHGSKTILDHRFDSQSNVWQPKRIDSRDNGSLINSGINQSAKHHVAADSSGTFKPRSSHTKSLQQYLPDNTLHKKSRSDKCAAAKQ